jgi:hypothetical protein
MEKANVLTNEGKARRLEDLAKSFQQRAKNFRVYAEACEKARLDDRAKSEHDIADLAESDAAVLREAAELMREQDKRSLLVERDWKGMYEAQERDMAALRQEREEAMAEIERLREHEARARWCEETKAQVLCSITNQTWRVLWYSEAFDLRQTSHADRNDAIDAARGGKV